MNKHTEVVKQNDFSVHKWIEMLHVKAQTYLNLTLPSEHYTVVMDVILSGFTAFYTLMILWLTVMWLTCDFVDINKIQVQ